MHVNPVGALLPRAPSQTSPNGANTSFGDMLSRAIESVNQYELEAERASLLLASGEITDIHTVTIAAQKAELALDLTLAVRNKVLESYQEIMRMQV